MKIKNKFKKGCLVFLVMACSYFAVNSAYAYSSEAVRLYNEGIENVENEDYERAAENFKEAIFQDKTLKDAYFNLGSVYKQLGEAEKAEETICTLLRKDPFDEEAAFLLAELYFDSAKYEKALFYLNTMTETSNLYDKAQKLITQTKEKIKERDFSLKKDSRLWEKRVIEGFNGPAGVIEDNTGNIYVANYKANTIQKIYTDINKRKDIISEKIQGPVGLAVDSQNNIYVAGYISNNILQISPEEEVKVVLDEINRPYFLFIKDDILYITEQDKNSMIMLNLWKLK